MPRGVYDRSKSKPRAHTTTGRYRKRKIMSDTTTAPENPTTEGTTPEPGFLDNLHEQLAKRQAQINDRLAEIEQQESELRIEGIALNQEGDLIRAGLIALEED
jgi:hypothetical protein